MQYQYYSGLPLCAITLPSYLLSGEEVAYNCFMNDSKLVFVLPTCYVYGELELSCALGSILVSKLYIECMNVNHERLTFNQDLRTTGNSNAIYGFPDTKFL